MLNAAEAILFGRKTYQHMAAYWPSSTDNDPIITHKMNSLPKIVFSTTLSSVDWKHSRLSGKPLAEEVRALKQQHGKDMLIFGSGSIVSALAQLGLIDEYRFIVTPVILGSGHALFKGLDAAVKLKRINTRTLASGNVILYYGPAH